MKFMKRISLFFIFATVMFTAGFLANVWAQDFFYPGKEANRIVNQKILSQEKTELEDDAEKTEIPAKETKTETDTEVEQASATDRMISADTDFLVQKYNLLTSQMEETVESMPDKYIGMSREQLLEEMASYSQMPSLKDKQEGFQGAEIQSFSSAQVVVRKFYEKQDQLPGFYLLNENNYVSVYYTDMQTIYLKTDISTSYLPEYLQQEIIQKKFVTDEAELFDFLEAYSS